MPGLLDLQTDLKSLKYGQDQPGGGSSRQPYITTDINDVDSTFNRIRLNRFDDGIVRGGTVGAINASTVDTLRISKFFADFPKGPLFLSKQVGLQLSNPRLESTSPPTDRPTTGGGFFNNVGNFISNTANRINYAVGPTRIYNLGVNTLAQIPINALGGHIIRHGLTPIPDPDKLYINVVRENNRNGINRLEKLLSKLNSGSLDKIDDYTGGPGSVYGIGNTLIRRAENPAGITGPNLTKGGFSSINRPTTNSTTVLITNTFDYAISKTTGSALISSAYGTLTEDLNPNISFIYKTGVEYTGSTIRKQTIPLNNNSDIVINGPSSYPEASGFKYQLDTLTTAYINPSTKTYATIQNGNAIIKDNSNTGWKSVDNNIDRTSSTYQYNIGGAKTIFNRINDIDVNLDTLAISFIPINPFDGTDLDTIKFRAYLTDYTDNSNSTWNDVKYVGRAEKFYIFNEYKRDISFGFNIPCYNKEELIDQHEKLNNLKSILAGTYDSNNLLGGIITKLKLGNYIDYEPGIINSLSFSIIEDSSWDLDDALAFYIKVTIGFTVIHNMIPRYKSKFINIPGRPANPFVYQSPSTTTAPVEISDNLAEIKDIVLDKVDDIIETGKFIYNKLGIGRILSDLGDIFGTNSRTTGPVSSPKSSTPNKETTP